MPKNDLKLEASYTNLRALLSMSRFYSFPSWSFSVSVLTWEKFTLDRIIMPTIMAPTILPKITRFFGVFLSPKAFLKSLITRLKEKLPVLAEEAEADIEF